MTTYSQRPPLKGYGCNLCDDGYPRWVPDDNSGAVHDALDFSWGCDARRHRWWPAVLVTGIILLAAALAGCTDREKEECEARGGSLHSITESSVGVGPASGGGIAVVPVFMTIRLCLAPDGRVLR